MKGLHSHACWTRFGAALIVATTLCLSGVSRAAVYVSVSIAPPVLPVYEQPLIPGPGYIWAPGYWAWGPDGFYWVPGTWVLAPFVGALWTPGYWAWSDGLYGWHAGYWGRHVGFYGGINYGFGYTGVGYHGGYWNHGAFTYNRTVNNVTNVRNVNVYNTTVVNNTSVTRASYNGGPSGVAARPAAQDRIAERDAHTPLLPVQSRHELAAHSNRAMLASVNDGKPTLTATARPQQFSADGPSPRSFSQQVAIKPGVTPPRTSVAVPNAKVSEHRQATKSPQAQMRADATERRQPPMHPQAQTRAPAQPQGGPSQGAPRGEGRQQQQGHGRGDKQEERQR